LFLQPHELLPASLLASVTNSPLLSRYFSDPRRDFYDKGQATNPAPFSTNIPVVSLLQLEYFFWIPSAQSAAKRSSSTWELLAFANFFSQKEDSEKE